MAVPVEILKKVKLLELRTRKLVDNVFAGEYHTHFKGQGMTFAEFREYVPGDDIRSISWPLTARTGKTFIKKYDEERELTVVLAVDISGSSDFGSGEYFKGEVMANLAALLALGAERNKDKVGLLLFSDQVEHFVPPGKGVGHVHRMLRDLYYFKPKSHRTKLSSALQYLQGVLKKRASVFILSDFLDEGFDSGLRMLGRRHEVVAVVVEDPLEVKLPAVGLVDLQDAETGEVVTIDTADPSFRAQFELEVKKRQKDRDDLLKKAQVERINIQNGKDFVDPVLTFFRRRR